MANEILLNKKGTMKAGQLQLVKTIDNEKNVNYTIRLVDYDREKTLKTFYELEEAQKYFEVA
jgi:hypothetical protein